jgi:ribulose-phosphate 3-epimerase
MKLAPSIYTADFAQLGQQVRDAEAAGVDLFHLDVMDGHFVPNITFGPAICAAVHHNTSLLCEAHLMVQDPERYFEDYKAAGMQRIIIHVEACKPLFRALQQIRALGMQPGIALNPLTPLAAIEEVLPLVDLVLAMSVQPGFGGQQYIHGTTARIAKLRAMLHALQSNAELEVDGGIHTHTIRAVRDAGASIVVVGSSIYTHKHSVAAGVKMLRAALRSPASQ